MKAWGEEEAWGIQWCRMRRDPCWRSWESHGRTLWRFCGRRETLLSECCCGTAGKDESVNYPYSGHQNPPAAFL